MDNQNVRRQEIIMDTNISTILAKFISGITYDDIPDRVVTETKKVLTDSIGCAIAGLHTKKGKIALSFTEKAKSPPEATIIGAGGKAPAAQASFANGELFNALDYDALSSPFGHITPYVLSAPLAAAEWKGKNGRDLIVAIALAHEIAQRISLGLRFPQGFSKETDKKGMSIFLPIHGYGVNIFGGIAGVARILELEEDKIEHAFGIGGYMCPVPTLMQFAEAVPSSMSKFSPSGWISQAQVTAALLAETGYVGDRNVFEGDFGFWKSFAADGWNPGAVVNNLGHSWAWPEFVSYKRYPCCGAMHGALDIFYSIVNKFNIKAEDIKEMSIVLNLLAELSLWKNRRIENHIDAQFSTAYVFAVAAHGIEIGHKWQAEKTYRSPDILDFMEKVKVWTPADQGYETKGHMVEVIVREKDATNEKRYTERDVWPVNGMVDDHELYEKFKRNAADILDPQGIEQALEIMSSLEELKDVGDLMRLFRSPA